MLKNDQEMTTRKIELGRISQGVRLSQPDRAGRLRNPQEIMIVATDFDLRYLRDYEELRGEI